jgi:hypothetical protein
VEIDHGTNDTLRTVVPLSVPPFRWAVHLREKETTGPEGPVDLTIYRFVP